jgi:hypothetical protein
MFESLFIRHLEDDEPLYIAVHKHWVVGVRHLLLPGSALLASWTLLYFAPITPVAYAVLVLDTPLALWTFRNFLNYFLDAWLITDRSVIDVEWHGFLHRTSTRIDYSSIEGVSYEIKGVLGTMFRYGTVTIERVGTGALVSIRDVKKPRDVESAILACQDACIRTKNMKDSAAVKDIIAEIVAERMYLKEKEEEVGEP